MTVYGVGVIPESVANLRSASHWTYAEAVCLEFRCLSR